MQDTLLVSHEVAHIKFSIKFIHATKFIHIREKTVTFFKYNVNFVYL